MTGHVNTALWQGSARGPNPIPCRFLSDRRVLMNFIFTIFKNKPNKTIKQNCHFHENRRCSTLCEAKQQVSEGSFLGNKTKVSFKKYMFLRNFTLLCIRL